MSNDEHDERIAKKKPKRYPLHWEEGLIPDDIDDRTAVVSSTDDE